MLFLLLVVLVDFLSFLVCVCVCACVRACVRSSVRACVRACVCVCLGGEVGTSKSVHGKKKLCSIIFSVNAGMLGSYYWFLLLVPICGSWVFFLSVFSFSFGGYGGGVVWYVKLRAGK